MQGHVVNLSQNIDSFLDTLPSNVNDLPILIVRCQRTENTHVDFRVRRSKVLSALHWLKQKNICYRNITIEDAVPPDLLVVDEDPNDNGNNISRQNEDSSNSTHDTDSHSFLPFPDHEEAEDNAIRSIIISNNALNWPAIGDSAITISCHHGIPSSLSSCHWRSYQSGTRVSCFHYR